MIDGLQDVFWDIKEVLPRQLFCGKPDIDTDLRLVQQAVAAQVVETQLFGLYV